MSEVAEVARGRKRTGAPQRSRQGAQFFSPSTVSTVSTINSHRARGIVPIPKRSTGRACRIASDGYRPSRIASRVQYASGREQWDECRRRLVRPPPVKTPCFHGTRCPPVLHAGRSAGRGYAAGHPRPPYDPSATAAQIALRALPSRLGRARTRSRFDETGRDGELRPCRAGRGAWRARVLTSTEVGVCGVLRTVPLGPVYRFRSATVLYSNEQLPQQLHE